MRTCVFFYDYIFIFREERFTRKSLYLYNDLFGIVKI